MEQHLESRSLLKFLSGLAVELCICAIIVPSDFTITLFVQKRHFFYLIDDNRCILTYRIIESLKNPNLIPQKANLNGDLEYTCTEYRLTCQGRLAGYMINIQ